MVIKYFPTGPEFSRLSRQKKLVSDECFRILYLAEYKEAFDPSAFTNDLFLFTLFKTFKYPLVITIN